MGTANSPTCHWHTPKATWNLRASPPRATSRRHLNRPASRQSLRPKCSLTTTSTFRQNPQRCLWSQCLSSPSWLRWHVFPSRSLGHVTPWACGREIKRVSTKQYAKEMPSQKIADASGNPVIVSAIVNYSVTDAKKAILNVQDVHEYVNTNAQATLKQVVSTYTYDQLKSMGAEINTRMRLQLAPWLEIAGVDVASICLNDLSYAPEAAAAMLKKQQAVALVQARELIVEGAVKIAQDAVQRLETDPDQPLEMDMDTRSRIITNILTVTCSESNAMPTLSL